MFHKLDVSDATTAPSGQSKSFPLIIALIFTFTLLLNVSQCCEHFCHLAYKDGSPDLPAVRRKFPTIVPVNFTGVVTIEAAYIPGYTAQYEYIRFMKDENHEPLVMQFYTPQTDYVTTLNIFAEDEMGELSGTRKAAFGLFDRKSDAINIQISDLHMTENNYYRIYLGEPGEAHKISYRYKSAENWEKLSFMWLNSTTHIKTDNQAIFFKSLSVCSDETPVLCGKSVETVAVSVYEAVNLSCSAYGAPFLEAVWSRPGNTRRKPLLSASGLVTTSTISLNSFSRNHMGIWECHWKNKNLGTISGTKTFHVVQLVSKPSQTTYVLQNSSDDQIFKWITRNKRPEESPDAYTISLECLQGNLDSSFNSKDSLWISLLTHFEEYSAVTEHSATVKLPEKITSDNITCTLYLLEKVGENESIILGELDTTTLYREGYHCEAGYYGLGEECVKCADDFTSLPRSTTCFPVQVELPEELQIVAMYDHYADVDETEKKEWKTAFSTNINVKIGVIIGIILLLALAITSVSFTIYVARKLDCI